MCYEHIQELSEFKTFFPVQNQHLLTLNLFIYLLVYSQIAKTFHSFTFQHSQTGCFLKKQQQQKIYQIKIIEKVENCHEKLKCLVFGTKKSIK